MENGKRTMNLTTIKFLKRQFISQLVISKILDLYFIFYFYISPSCPVICVFIADRNKKNSNNIEKKTLNRVSYSLS